MNAVTEVFGGGFTNKVVLYVPATTEIDKPLDSTALEALTNRCTRFMAELFGGATVLQARGAWVTKDGKLVFELTTLVYSFTDVLTTADLQKVKRFCTDLKTELRQEAIAVEINNELYFA